MVSSTVTAAITNGGHLASSAASSSPALSMAGPTQISSKAKAMQLGASRTSTTAATPVDPAEWLDEAEAEVGTTNAWDGDLMDVSADADDWSKCIFE